MGSPRRISRDHDGFRPDGRAGRPPAIAVGTDVLQIRISGAFGTFTSARPVAVALPVVGFLLLGSAFGVRIGAVATNLVVEVDINGYFAAVLLAGSAAVAANKLGSVYGIEVLSTSSTVPIFGAALPWAPRSSFQPTVGSGPPGLAHWFSSPQHGSVVQYCTI